jgi:hypothetical protein
MFAEIFGHRLPHRIEDHIDALPASQLSCRNAGTKSLSPANLVAVVQAVTLRERSEVPTGGGAT